MTNPEKDEILEFELAGQLTKFRVPDFGQLALVQHQAKILTGDFTVDQGARALSLVYRSLRSWFVANEDAERMEDLLADGYVTIENVFRDMMAAIKSTKPEPAPTTGPVVRRGRPRKAAS